MQGDVLSSAVVIHAKATGSPTTDAAGRVYRLLTSSDELASIREDWDRLWAAAQAEYFLGFSSTFQSWDMIHRRQGRSLACAVVQDEGRLLGVLPMVLQQHKLWRTASACAPQAAECSDILIAKSDESAVIARVLLEKFLARARPDYLEFDFVKLGSHLDLAIQGIPRLKAIEAWDEQVPYADLKAETDWRTYHGSLDKKYRSECLRRLRRIGEQGQVTFEVVRGEPTPLIDWLFVQKRKWCERTNKHGNWIYSSHYQEFANALFASDPRYLVFALKLNGMPIAVKLVVINTISASWVLITYDEDYRRFSPGSLLDEYAMQYIFDNYRDSDGKHLDIDFGPGMEEFKLHWSRGNLHTARGYRIVASRWGEARLWMKNRSIKRQVD